MKLQLDPQTAAKLKHIKLLHPNKGVEGTFPDFLIVGPQRTGTTWLEANLRRHPEIFTAYPKEIYFFSRLLQGDKNRHSKHYYQFDSSKLVRQPVQAGKDLAKIVYFDYLLTGKADATQLDWYLPYFDHTKRVHKEREKEAQEMYGESFRPKVFGEATATYATLHPEIIEDILIINPDIKIILMVRDPVKRAWSHAKKDLMRYSKRKFEEVPEEEFIRFFKDDYQLECANYSGHIQKWRSYLPEGNFYVGFHDDVKNKPEDMLLDVFSFLGVTADPKYI
ncbi:MAG: sulfotransferase, partial [Bacteroidota bacterium]